MPGVRQAPDPLDRPWERLRGLVLPERVRTQGPIEVEADRPHILETNAAVFALRSGLESAPRLVPRWDALRDARCAQVGDARPRLRHAPVPHRLEQAIREGHGIGR